MSSGAVWDGAQWHYRESLERSTAGVCFEHSRNFLGHRCLMFDCFTLLRFQILPGMWRFVVCNDHMAWSLPDCTLLVELLFQVTPQQGPMASCKPRPVSNRPVAYSLTLNDPSTILKQAAKAVAHQAAVIFNELQRTGAAGCQQCNI